MGADDSESPNLLDKLSLAMATKRLCSAIYVSEREEAEACKNSATTFLGSVFFPNVPPCLPRRQKPCKVDPRSADHDNPASCNAHTLQLTCDVIVLYHNVAARQPEQPARDRTGPDRQRGRLEPHGQWPAALESARAIRYRVVPGQGAVLTLRVAELRPKRPGRFGRQPGRRLYRAEHVLRSGRHPG